MHNEFSPDWVPYIELPFMMEVKLGWSSVNDVNSYMHFLCTLDKNKSRCLDHLIYAFKRIHHSKVRGIVFICEVWTSCLHTIIVKCPLPKRSKSSTNKLQSTKPVRPERCFLQTPVHIGFIHLTWPFLSTFSMSVLSILFQMDPWPLTVIKEIFVPLNKWGFPFSLDPFPGPVVTQCPSGNVNWSVPSISYGIIPHCPFIAM